MYEFEREFFTIERKQLEKIYENLEKAYSELENVKNLLLEVGKEIK